MREWESTPEARTLIDSYQHWCTKKRISEHNIITDTALGTYLKSAGFESKRTNGKTIRKMLNLSEAIKKLEEYEGINIKTCTDFD